MTAAAWNSNHSLLYYLCPSGLIPVEQTQVAPYKSIPLPPLCPYLKYYITPFKTSRLYINRETQTACKKRQYTVQVTHGPLMNWLAILVPTRGVFKVNNMHDFNFQPRRKHCYLALQMSTIRQNQQCKD